ncbi:MAG: PTS sugar transporter subunit IIB [Betaproteobacteria bacterium]|nr:PTS sugar transporter subunit IIB [Betaproteobacteria bacterium]NCX44521.1 PTS sugar transporter subunit IIB [Betaproteobacteria bacterium]
MIGVLVISHEPLGTALIRATRHVYGRLPAQLAALDVVPDEDPELAYAAACELSLRINDGSGLLVLTDCFGATPSRIAMRLAKPQKAQVLAGVNLPMLLKALAHRRIELCELVASVSATGQHAICEMAHPNKESVK